MQVKVGSKTTVTALKLLIMQHQRSSAEQLPPSQQRLYVRGAPLDDDDATLGEIGIVARTPVHLWLDTSVPADIEEAYARLHSQTAEEKNGRPRKAEGGFLGSALLASSFPKTTDDVDDAADAAGAEA